MPIAQRFGKHLDLCAFVEKHLDVCAHLRLEIALHRVRKWGQGATTATRVIRVASSVLNNLDFRESIVLIQEPHDLPVHVIEILPALFQQHLSPTLVPVGPLRIADDAADTD